jgi:exonuclease SbcC
MPAAPLAQAARDLDDLRALFADKARALTDASRARAAGETAEAALAAAEEAHRRRLADLEAAQQAHVIAGLRPHLTVGEDCPVCEHPVTVLPPAVQSDGLDRAREAVRACEQDMAGARRSAQAAASASAKADAALDALARRQAGLLESLAATLDGPLAGASLPAARTVIGGALRTADANDAQAGGATQAGAVHEALPGNGPAVGIRRARTERGADDGAANGGPGGDAAGADGLLARALAEVTALTQARANLERAAESAATVVQAARAGQRRAQQTAERLAAELSGAQATLRAARDPLVELGAPQVDDGNLAAGWAALARWAQERAGDRETELAQARRAARAAGEAHQRLAAEFDAAEGALSRLRARSRAASGDSERAQARLDQAGSRIAELDALLAGAADEAEVTRLLQVRDRLETAASGAEQALRAARAARSRGEAALTALVRAEGAARRELAAARDTVVSLGAPELGGGARRPAQHRPADAQGEAGAQRLPGGQGPSGEPGPSSGQDAFREPGGPGEAGRGSLLADWTELVTWAAGQAAEREVKGRAASGAVAAARTGLERLAGELSAGLAEAGITVAPDAVATRAASEAAMALERARAAVRRIEERRGEAAELDGRQQAAKAEEQVARMLGDLLRANNFQRWLVSAAVEDLVTEASLTLASLSGGQFELTQRDGEFYVTDHADADAQRSVRTLSGGETFQASIALALALSSQISALATAGAARLDSIFLDEGFGTLDPETLDTVASTLETLAQGQRMVGVVTHVQALAERVPVRFRVTRNPQTSVITREGLAGTESAGAEGGT